MKKTTKQHPAAPADGIAREDASQKPFVKANYLMMGGCILLIIIGFLLMAGGGSGDNGFNPDIFSTRRIVVGPAITFIGFLLMAFAILYSPSRRKGNAGVDESTVKE